MIGIPLKPNSKRILLRINLWYEAEIFWGWLVTITNFGGSEET
jgi:hypothetical protein